MPISLSRRRAIESPVNQGSTEEIAYEFDWSKWGTDFSSLTAILLDKDLNDVTSTKTTGTAQMGAVGSGIVISPYVKLLEIDEVYILIIRGTESVSNSIVSGYLEIIGEL